ncbi:MAG: hypothetical protein APR63_10545 [Desulfuromonas sp. SDB]|nr:MAG: hypothetical protein APR63_10545 [Desulfuromonas sp. SDB]
MESKSKAPPLRTIYWYLAGSCNLNCRHCWIDPHFGEDGVTYLPWKKMKPLFEEAKNLGLVSVKLTGGEPLLHPEFTEILYALKEMKLGITVETNGTLVGESEAKAIAETVSFVSVSLDGTTVEFHEDLRQVDGCFKNTLKGIENLQKYNKSFQIIFSLYRKNMDNLFEMVAFAEKQGANSLKVNPVNETDRSREMKNEGELLSVKEILDIHDHLKKVTKDKKTIKIYFDIPPAFKALSLLRKHGFQTCGIFNILGVLHTGRASICGIGSVVKELDLGDPFEIGLEKIWKNNNILNEIRKKLPNRLTGICGKCMLKNYCLGKCIANTYFLTGDLFNGFIFCEQAYNQGLFPETRLIP